MIQILLDGLFTEKRSGIEKYIEKSGRVKSHACLFKAEVLPFSAVFEEGHSGFVTGGPLVLQLVLKGCAFGRVSL
jgi:hypothetical protein